MGKVVIIRDIRMGGHPLQETRSAAGSFWIRLIRKIIFNGRNDPYLFDMRVVFISITY